MGKFSRTIMAVGLCGLLGGPVWAQGESVVIKSVGVLDFSGVLEWRPGPDATNPTSSFRNVSRGVDSVLGTYTCYSAGTGRSAGAVDPPEADTEGLCADPTMVLVWAADSYAYEYAECRLDDTGDVITFELPGVLTSCIPYSCYTEPFLTEEGGEVWPLSKGCTYPIFYTTHSESRFGTSTNDVVATITIESSEWDADQGVLTTRSVGTAVGAAETTLAVDVSLDDLPPNEAMLEIPAVGTTASGINLISGWSCVGGDLQAKIEGTDGTVIATIDLAHGTDRADTMEVCGDTANGFSASVNWNLIGSGERILRLIQNGEEVAARAIEVFAFGEEFQQGLMHIAAAEHFPAEGQDTVLEWQEVSQSFVVTGTVPHSEE